MISTWKDIAVFLDTTEQGQRVSRHAAALAQRHGSHLVGVYGALRQRFQPAESYVRGGAITDVLSRHRSAEEASVLAAGRAFSDLSAEVEITSEFRVVWRDAADEDAALRSLHCDLIVAGNPKPRDLPETWTGERLLLTSGAPVLMIPDAWAEGPVGRTVVIAWNGSRAARRAVNDALPLLATAERVVVLVVNSDRDVSRSDDAHTSEIVRHLGRHDVAAELLQVEGNGAPVPDVVLSHCRELGADVLIIGAYSHPRTAELLFGGVTRSLLAQAKLPLFISR